MIGETILGYKVEEKIGSGGFGTVYKVSKTNASGTYIRALKHITIPTQKQYADVLNSMGGDHSKANDYFASVLKEIVNEIQIISKLSESGTKNIVRYYENDIVETNNPKRYDIYILMECLTPFTDYIYENEFTVRDVINLGKNILEALISCHKQKVVHRDIKDDNIFISNDGTFKLGDFGVSKILSDRSRAESMKGTPNYIAPEVYLGKETYDNTVDIYSLGIVLYKLLNKSRSPFLPEYPDTYNTDDEYVAFDKRMKGEIPPQPYDAKNALGEVIVKAISPRNLRYNSAEEFFKSLKEAEMSLSAEELNKVINQDLQIVKPKAGTSFAKDDAPIIPQDNLMADNDSTMVFEQSLYTDSDSTVIFRQDSNTNNNGNINMDNNKSSISSNNSMGKWVAYLLPVLILTIYIVIYVFAIPRLYGRAIGTLQWVFSNPKEVLEILTSEDITIRIRTIRLIKICAYILWTVFIASLFNLGRYLQNKKPEYNINAVVRDKEPYLKSIELNESIKAGSCKEADEAKRQVRIIMEHLRNESDFGYGMDSVIANENDILMSLQAIEKSIKATYDESTARNASEFIISECKNIQSKLKIREELKKK